MENDSDRIGEGIDNLLGSAVALDVLLDPERFRSYASGHIQAPFPRVLVGYRLAIEALVRVLEGSIEDSSGLHLSEDEYFRRANFAGIRLARVPPTCEKTVLLKNVERFVRPVVAATSFVELAKRARSLRRNVVTPLLRLKTISEVGKQASPHSLDKVVRYNALFLLHIHLNDVERGFPKGLLRGIEGGPRRQQSGRSVIAAYAVALKFLWSRLDIEGRSRQAFEGIEQSADWRDVDQIFDRLRPVADDLEGEIGAKFGWDSLVFVREDPRPILRRLLVRRRDHEPQDTAVERVERSFLWYPVQLVGSANLIFNGVPAFVTSLEGAVSVRRNANASNPVRVIRIRHPLGRSDHADFSYAVLLEASGTLSDYSGWLLFYNCCGNYSGFGGSQHALAEATISRHESSKEIEVVELVLGKDAFLDAANNLFGRVLPAARRRRGTQLRQKIIARLEKKYAGKLSVLENRHSAATGLLLELLSYYTSTNRASMNSTILSDWQFVQDKKEIDVIVRDAVGIRFIECKLGQFDAEKEADNLIAKSKALMASKDFRRRWLVDEHTHVRNLILTWRRPPDQVRAAVERKGVWIAAVDRQLDLVRKDKARPKDAFGY